MRYAARSGCPTPPQYRELPDHYRWVPDSLADDQMRVNRQHDYINEALAEAAFRVFGADSGVKPGDRFSLSEVISKLAGYDNGDFGEPEKVSSRWQSEAKKTLLQTGLFSYDRTGRVGRRKPFVYVGEPKPVAVADLAEAVTVDASPVSRMPRSVSPVTVPPTDLMGFRGTGQTIRGSGDTETASVTLTPHKRAHARENLEE